MSIDNLQLLATVLGVISVNAGYWWIMIGVDILAERDSVVLELMPYVVFVLLMLSCGIHENVSHMKKEQQNKMCMERER